MTTTPTASPELPDLNVLLAIYSTATINYSKHGDIRSYYNDLVGAENAIRELLDRRAKPDREAPQADLEQLNGGMHDSIFVKVWGDAGGGDAGRRKLADYAYALGKRASISLSPLCGAQHAESGKEDDAELPSNEELERVWESHVGHPADFAADVLQRWGGWQPGLLGYGGKLEAVLAAQQAAAPADCSGTPSSCPDNEGYGCHCSAPGTPEAPLAAAVRALADKWQAEAVADGFATHEGAIELDELLAAQLDGGQEGSAT